MHAAECRLLAHSRHLQCTDECPLLGTKRGPADEEISKGGRGKKNAVKAKAMEANAALPKEQQVSERTIKRSIAKSEGRTPTPRGSERRHDPEKRKAGLSTFRVCSRPITARRNMAKPPKLEP
jgi:hypothetical protein